MKLEGNQKFLVLGLGTFALIVTVSILFYHYMNHQTAEEYYEAALKEIENDNPGKGAKYLKVALYYDDEYADAYYLRGKLRCEIFKEYHNALPDLENALANYDQPDPMIYYFLGKCHLGQQNFPEAIKQFEKSLELDPQNDSSHYYLAEIRTFYSPDYSKAVENYSQSLAKSQSYKAWFGRGMAYYNLKKYKESIADFGKAIEANPKEAKFYYHRALSEFAINDSLNGCTDCGTAINMDFHEANELAEKYCISEFNISE